MNDSETAHVTKKRKWLLGIGILSVLGTAALLIAAYLLSHRLEPYIRHQAIEYLQKRFDSEVELGPLQARMPTASSLKVLLWGGHDRSVRVEGEGISLRHRGRRDIPPIFAMKKFAFEVDLATLFNKTKTVHSVMIDGMEINIPPKADRPKFHSGPDEDSKPAENQPETDVIIEQVLVTNSDLTIFPKQQDHTPLHFALHRIKLESAGKNVAMKYEATLTNAKPPGEIQSKGTFGPWAAAEPGDTPLAGEYDFEHADLGVFSGIAGTLNSTGQFEGTLNSIQVRGEASVPNFRLKTSGNPVSLKTRFDVLVDGTNGNTILKPVVGRLGTTSFTTSGGIIKHEKAQKHAISLDVTMPNGDLRDVLTLAMKGPPFMEGRLSLHTHIDIPPLSGKVREKLRLDGRFELSQTRFLKSKIQNEIDTLSRRGRGEPGNEDIVEVPSGMAGSFRLADEVITFRSLSFAVAGAGVDLTGSYDLARDTLDFHGSLKLRAKVSETMTGWKRWALKPLNPFFAKQGAGTLINIQVTGTSKEPKFERDHGKKEKELAESTR